MKMAVSNAIELETSENLKNKGFQIIKDGQTILLEDRQGNQARSYIYKEWNKTVKKFEDVIEETQIVTDRLTLQEILACLTKNYNKIYNNNNNGDNGSKSSIIALDSVNDSKFETETPLDKLNDITPEYWRTQLSAKYNVLQETIKNSITPLPQLKLPLEFALSVKNVLNIYDNTLPFAGFLLGAPSSLKTVTVELFRAYWHAKYTDDFSPKAFVSHYSGLPKEKLTEIDLLPKIRFKFFLTPELAPLFTGNEDEIKKAFGNLTRILDGKGFQSDSGTQGGRGYHGNYMFSWLGAVVDVSSRVHRLMGNLGPKMYFLRLSKSYQKEKDLVEQIRNPRFSQDLVRIQEALFDYLKWFEACPLMETSKEGGLPKMVWDSNKDDIKALRQIARLARLIGHMRGVVDVENTEDSQGSSYGYTIPIIEEPNRANQQLYNLARGHALVEGRNYITLADIPLLIKVVLSTAPIARVAVFEMLIANNGILRTVNIKEGLGISHHTVHKSMTELELLGLVDVKKDGDSNNSEKIITLKNEFQWCLGTRFRQLRQGFFTKQKARKRPQIEKRSPKQGDNMELDSTKLEERSKPVIQQENNKDELSMLFWTTYKALENPQNHTVSKSSFRQSLISSGKFTASEATQAIKEAIDSRKLTRLGYDVLANNSHQTYQGLMKNEQF